jgi:hypothetical protein
MFDFKVDCHISVTTFYQIYPIKFYVIIGFFRGGPDGATFTTNGTGATGILGGGNGLPRSLSVDTLVDTLVDFDFLIGFLSIPGSPVDVLER